MGDKETGEAVTPTFEPRPAALLRHKAIHALDTNVSEATSLASEADKDISEGDKRIFVLRSELGEAHLEISERHSSMGVANSRDERASFVDARGFLPSE